MIEDGIDGAQRAPASAIADRGREQPRFALEALIFEIASQRFALPARDVAEVVRAVAMRALPQAPVVVEGIIDLRGQIVPVLDLRLRFGLTPSALRTSDHLIITSTDRRLCALRVDRALAITELDALPIERAPHLPAGLDCIAGVAAVAGDIVLIHDVRTFLSDAEAFQLEGALAAGVPPPEVTR